MRYIKDIFAWITGGVLDNSDRSRSLILNVTGSFLIKGVGVAISYINLPIVLHYLNTEKYGVWLTLVSFVGWFSFFDLGISNGLKNKLIEAKANNDVAEMKRLISSAYYYSGILLTIVSVVFYIVAGYINWQTVFNIESVTNPELTLIIRFTFTFFCVNLVLNQIVTILHAYQRVAIGNTLVPFGNLCSLGVIYILSQTTSESLVFLALSLSGIPVLISLLYNIFLFNREFKSVRPSYRSKNYSSLKKIMALSVKFFFIQLTSVIMFTSTNLIIAQVSGPADVTVYNIASKLMNLTMMIFALLIQPFWPYFTDAFHRGDNNWIIKIIKKINYLAILFVLLQVILLVSSDWLYFVWVGDKVKVPFVLSLVLSLLSVYSIVFAIYDSCANALGKMNLSMYVVVVKAIIYLPIAIFLTSTYGLIGIPVSLLILNIPSSILQVIQVNRIINRTATGIWNA